MSYNRTEDTNLCGQLSAKEREIIIDAITTANPKPLRLIEIGSWYGGGSTLHILKVLRMRNEGCLWGIEADPSIYESLVTNMSKLYPEEYKHFVPLLGRSVDVLPTLLLGFGKVSTVDFAFLDGGDNPGEQIAEFKLLDSNIPVGGQIMSHDAKLRKGRWFIRYISSLDNWSTHLYDISEEGLFHARKTRSRPSTGSRIKAELILFIKRLNIVELLAAVFPPCLNKFILEHIPKSLAIRLSQGRVK